MGMSGGVHSSEVMSSEQWLKQLKSFMLEMTLPWSCVKYHWTLSRLAGGYCLFTMTLEWGGSPTMALVSGWFYKNDSNSTHLLSCLSSICHCFLTYLLFYTSLSPAVVWESLCHGRDPGREKRKESFKNVQIKIVKMPGPISALIIPVFGFLWLFYLSPCSSWQVILL